MLYTKSQYTVVPTNNDVYTNNVSSYNVKIPVKKD